jgi:hypothetical protein
MKLDYDGISPITGNKCVIIEADENANINSYMCMESGYTTTDNFKTDSKSVEQYEKTITELMREIKFIDEKTNLVWYPSFLHIPGAGMLYCSGDKQNMKWEVAPVVEIIGDERLKYPIPNKKGEYYTSKLDTENSIKYDKENFTDALDEFYSCVAKAQQ